jgi:AraC-like DNA-binding protein
MGRGPAPHRNDDPGAPAAADLLVLPPDLGHVLLRTSRSEAEGSPDGIIVPFDPASAIGHARSLLGAARADDPRLRRFLRPGPHTASDEPARRTIMELPLFLCAPGVPDPDSPDAHALQATDIVVRAVARLMLVLAGEDAARIERRDLRVPADRACGFMVMNIARPLSLDDLVQVTGASSRALQYAFQSRFGMSPMRWLREQRLRRLHAALQRADDAQGVTELAVGLGFAHLGRLGQVFEQRFGLLPSHLLRRARRG